MSSFYKEQAKKHEQQILDAGYEIKEDGTVKDFGYNFKINDKE